MRVSFNKAKTIFHRIGNTDVYTKEGTIANGQRYLNWTRKVKPAQIKETVGVLERVPDQDYFSDIYSFVVRKINRYSKDGNVRTEVEKLTNGKGSTFTVMENGIRSFKFVYDVDGTHLKTILYNDKGLKAKEIEVR
ncbi:hypothetical protein IJ472_05095 [bacterium]|nr:hypothetical protein [bacterium]